MLISCGHLVLYQEGSFCFNPQISSLQEWLFIIGAFFISGRAKENTKNRKDNATFIPPQYIGDSHDNNDDHDSSDGSGGDGGGGGD